jgi:hypothetical protein
VQREYPANVPLRTAEVATITGWSTKRTARYLDGLTLKDPSIVIRVRGRRMVTLASIRRVDPDFGKKFASDFDIKKVEEEQIEQAGEIKLLAAELKAFQRKSWDWYNSVSGRLRALETEKRKRTDADGNGQS